MTDATELWDAYNKATKGLGEFAGSFAVAARNDREQVYGRKYQSLVKAGLARQLKRSIGERNGLKRSIFYTWN